MSRLHTIQASISEIAAHFDAEAPADLHVTDQTTEGMPGLVVIERDGKRYLRPYHWGFPRRTLETAIRDEPPEPLGLVADLTSPMWNRIVTEPRYRCLIVLTHFANPEGDPGAKTRTWFSVKDHPIIAWAGFCRNTPEFGPAYAGMTRQANGAIPPTNDRMPVILMPDQYSGWLSGSIEDVIRFQFGPTIAGHDMVVEQTAERWRSAGLPTVLKQGALF